MKKSKAKTNKTHVVLVLDTSGSMDDDSMTPNRRAATIVGFNEQVQQIRLNSKDVETYVSLETFNGNVFEHFWNKPGAEIVESNLDDYKPTGSTAMRDAVGYVIDKLQSTTDSSDENTAYLVIVMSDGWENASEHFTAGALKEMIEALKKTNRWTFTYMGCDEKYLAVVAKETGIPLDNMAKYSTSTKGTMRAACANTGKTAEYFAARAVGGFKTSNFYSDECGAVADYSDSGVDKSFVMGCGIDSEGDPDDASVCESKEPEPVFDTTKLAKYSNVFGTGKSVAWEK